MSCDALSRNCRFGEAEPPQPASVNGVPLRTTPISLFFDSLKLMEDLAPPGDTTPLIIKPPDDDEASTSLESSKLQDRIKKRLASPAGNQKAADATLGSPTGSGPSANARIVPRGPVPPSPLFSAPLAPPPSRMPTSAEPAESAEAESATTAYATSSLSSANPDSTTTAAEPTTAPPLADLEPPAPAVEAEEEQQPEPASPAPALSALATPPAPGPAESPAQTEAGGDGSEDGRGGAGAPSAGSPAETPESSPTTARRAAQGPATRKGWLLKKSATKKDWAKSPHSNRYFVSRGHAVSYFDRKADSGTDTLGLRGVINMRQVLQLRCPSTDVTAPNLAFDIVLKTRTYTLVPQPPTVAERDAWLDLWRKVVPEAALRERVVASTSSLPDAAAPSEADSSSRRSRAALIDGVSKSLSRVSLSVFRTSAAKRDSNAVAAKTAAAAAAAAEVNGGASSVAAAGAETPGAGGGAADDGTAGV